MRYLFLVFSSLVLGVYSKFYFFLDFLLYRRFNTGRVLYFTIIIFFLGVLGSLKSDYFNISESLRLPVYIYFSFLLSNFIFARKNIVFSRVFYLLVFLQFLNFVLLKTSNFNLSEFSRLIEFSTVDYLDDGEYFDISRLSIGNPSSFSLILFISYILKKNFNGLKKVDFVLIFICLLLTGSRSILFILFFYTALSTFKRFKYFYIGAVVMACIIYFQNQDFFVSDNRLFKIGGSGDLLRLTFYEEFFKLLPSSVLIGNSPGYINFIVNDIISREMSAESLYIEIISSYGLVFFIWLIFKAHKLLADNTFLLTFLLIGFVIPVHNYILFWVLIFLKIKLNVWNNNIK